MRVERRLVQDRLKAEVGNSIVAWNDGNHWENSRKAIGAGDMNFWQRLMAAFANPHHNESDDIKKEPTLREGIHGTWHYHYATVDGTQSLCGAPSMLSHAPESTWGYRSHLNERYCRKCLEIRTGQTLT